MKIAGEFDRRYHGKVLPAKLKIAVSACVNQCAENCIRDIGLFGKNDGWTITIGGNGGAKPCLAVPFASGCDDEEALTLVDRLISFYAEHARKFDRMAKLIKRVGMDEIKRVVMRR
jgi:NAD(P)H-nitrite reductase large subunit